MVALDGDTSNLTGDMPGQHSRGMDAGRRIARPSNCVAIV